MEWASSCTPIGSINKLFEGPVGPSTTAFEVRVGDAVRELRKLPSECIQAVITSPPYWLMRDYGKDGQIGRESTPQKFIATLVEVFREVRRVLKPDGTLWLNLGDGYTPKSLPGFCKATELIGMPWRLALALSDDGWYLRQEIIWHKPNPMPESVRNRPTRCHEQLFLFAKSKKYYYDAKAIEEPAICANDRRAGRGRIRYGGKRNGEAGTGQESFVAIRDTRNKRTVWNIPVQHFAGAHFATFPTALVEPCILAGSRCGDIVCDPFGGAGTTGVVAVEHNRHYIGIEISPEYATMAEERIALAIPEPTIRLDANPRLPYGLVSRAVVPLPSGGTSGTWSIAYVREPLF